MGFIYCITFDNGSTKIGKTGVNVSRRIRSHIRTAKTFGVNVVDSKSFQVEDEDSLELALLGYCRNKYTVHAGKEWFNNVNLEEISSFVTSFKSEPKVLNSAEKKHASGRFYDYERTHNLSIMILCRNQAYFLLGDEYSENIIDMVACMLYKIGKESWWDVYEIARKDKNRIVDLAVEFVAEHTEPMQLLDPQMAKGVRVIGQILIDQGFVQVA